MKDEDYVNRLKAYLNSKDYRTTQVKPVDSAEFKGYHFHAGIKDLAYKTADITPSIIGSPEYLRSAKAFSKIEQLVLSEKISVYRENETIAEFTDIESMIAFFKEAGRKGLSFQRYKGLGEMNPEQLWETTMNPEKRTLLQVSIRDADEAENLFTTLMGEKIEPRKEFIQNHALEVTELDI
jgi:DNA gyrase subunit B